MSGNVSIGGYYMVLAMEAVVLQGPEVASVSVGWCIFILFYFLLQWVGLSAYLIKSYVVVTLGSLVSFLLSLWSTDWVKQPLYLDVPLILIKIC